MATSAPTSKPRNTSTTATSANNYAATSRRLISLTNHEPQFHEYLTPGTMGVHTFKYCLTDRNVQNLDPSRSCLPGTFLFWGVPLDPPPERRLAPGPNGIAPQEYVLMVERPNGISSSLLACFLKSSMVCLFPVVWHQAKKCLLVVEIRSNKVVSVEGSQRSSLVQWLASSLVMAKLSIPKRKYSAMRVGEKVLKPLLPLIDADIE
ncbi:hypothetical protein P9112_012410 [Eukaryota sp. TZLM1-RC]